MNQNIQEVIDALLYVREHIEDNNVTCDDLYAIERAINKLYNLIG